MKRATKGVESSLFEKSKEHIVESKCKLHLILCSISLHMLNSNHLLFEYWIMDDTILLTRIASSLAFTKILLNHHIHWITTSNLLKIKKGQDLLVHNCNNNQIGLLCALCPSSTSVGLYTFFLHANFRIFHIYN